MIERTAARQTEMSAMTDRENRKWNEDICQLVCVACVMDKTQKEARFLCCGHVSKELQMLNYMDTTAEEYGRKNG